MVVSDSRVRPAARSALSAGLIGRTRSSVPSDSFTVIEQSYAVRGPGGVRGVTQGRGPSAPLLRLLAQGPRHHEADAGALVVDRAGLVVDQPELLRARDQVHLVHV